MELILMIIPLLVAIFYLFCYMKLFSKGGEPMWKAIIPIYSQYTYYKIIWKPSVFFRMILWSVLYSVSLALNINYSYSYDPYSMGASPMELVTIIAMIVFGLLLTILSIRTIHHLSTSFGYGVGMTILLILFPFITFPIISLGSCVYYNPHRADKTDDMTPLQSGSSNERPGSVLDSPLTYEEKQILVNIRNKKAMGDRNYTEDEKAVLKKLKWQKEYGVR